MLTCRINFLILAMIFPLAACAAPTPSQTPTLLPPTTTTTPSPTSTATLVPDPPPLPIDLTEVGPITPTLPITDLTLFGFTFQDRSGNRFVEGSGTMSGQPPVEVLLEGSPNWIVGVPVDGGGAIWSVTLEDGRVQSFLALAGTVTAIDVQPDALPPGQPPVLMIQHGFPRLIVAPGADASPLTNAVVVGGDPSRIAYIATDGDLVIAHNGAPTRLEVNALPDARILQDGAGRLLLLSGATERYPHGVLGDVLEAESMTLLDGMTGEIIRTISVQPQVVEGISPIWADLDLDGELEIIAAISDETIGSQIVVFNEDGNRIAQGPTMGRGFLWRHILAAAPFETDLNLMIAEILTPHETGITQLFSFDPVAGLAGMFQMDGFSTHRLGSRNLDMALAGDLDGDGLVELLIPAQDGSYLGAIRYSNGFAAVAWTVGLGSPLATNLAAVQLLNGMMAVAAGLADGTLLLWMP